MTAGPKFNEVLRAYGAGLTRPWDARYDNMKPGVIYGSYVDPEDKLAEKQARSTRAAFEALALVYEKYEEGQV